MFPIPSLDEKKVDLISSRVKEAILRREQSKQLLEIAKTGVEKAIEMDETIATDWINEQLETLGIS
jgi:type I restriction enzyme M protein